MVDICDFGDDFDLFIDEGFFKAVLGWCSLFVSLVACRALVPFHVTIWSCRFSYIIWAVDCSVYIMILVTKLTYYGKWLEQKEDRKEISFESFMAYNLFFPSVLTGPTFSYEIF